MNKEEKCKQLEESAKEKFERKDYEGAIEDYNEARLLNPCDIFLLDKLAEAKKALEAKKTLEARKRREQDQGFSR